VNVVNPDQFFPIPQGTLPWQPIFNKTGKMTFIQHPGILKRIGISQYDKQLYSANDASNCVQIA